jgi:hypothetical protein
MGIFGYLELNPSGNGAALLDHLAELEKCWPANREP